MNISTIFLNIHPIIFDLVFLNPLSLLTDMDCHCHMFCWCNTRLDIRSANPLPFDGIGI
jgi:hypothetical protein